MSKKNELSDLKCHWSDCDSFIQNLLDTRDSYKKWALFYMAPPCPVYPIKWQKVGSLPNLFPPR